MSPGFPVTERLCGGTKQLQVVNFLGEILFLLRNFLFKGEKNV